MVVDVTDPASAADRAAAPRARRARTRVTCVVQTDCTYAYSAGDDSTRPASRIFDLRDLDQPVEVDSDAGARPGCRASLARPPGTSGTSTPPATARTPASRARRCGDDASPRAPRLVTTTGAAGRGEDPGYPGWNDFILHNSSSVRTPRRSATVPTPSLANGNVLLVTEEDYEQTDCSKAGSFQTWWVKRLDGTKDAIVPLDKVELADLGTYPLPGRRVLLVALVRLPPLRASSLPASTAAAPSSSTYATRRT